MTSVLRGASPLEQPTLLVRESIREALQYAHSTFGAYRRLFERAGISNKTISDSDPLDVIGRLPITGSDMLAEVSLESVQAVDRIVDMETSSGTTGARKKRFISSDDDVRDHEFMADLFRAAGITKNDRAACVDTDPVYLMVSFARALDVLGTEETYVYSVGRDYERGLHGLARLDPTAVFAVPSMFERLLGPLRRAYETANGKRSLSRVIFVGERVPHQLRKELNANWGVEVFSYYGAAEAASLGIECVAHDCIHLFTDRNFFEIRPSEHEGSDGQVIVTSLVQRTAPLLRYALGDEIVVRQGKCSCGLLYPRVDVIGRTGDRFSILGSQFHYASFLRSAYSRRDEIGYMQLVLTESSCDVLTVVLPKAMIPHEESIKTSLLSQQLELEFLVSSKLAALEFAYVDDAYFSSSRKMKLVDDRR